MKYNTEANIKKWADDKSTSHIVFLSIHSISNSINECVERFFNPIYKSEVCESILNQVKPLFLEYTFLKLPYITWLNKKVHFVFAYRDNGELTTMNSSSLDEALIERPTGKIFLLAKYEEVQYGCIQLN